MSYKNGVIGMIILVLHNGKHTLVKSLNKFVEIGRKKRGKSKVGMAVFHYANGIAYNFKTKQALYFNF
jgi:hypothetical protein